MTVNAIRQWLGQLPDAILAVTGLKDTQNKLMTVERLGQKQRPATVEVIAKQLGIVCERAKENPGLLQGESMGEPPEAMDLQVADTAEELEKENDVDVHNGDCAEALETADAATEGISTEVKDSTHDNDGAI